MNSQFSMIVLQLTELSLTTNSYHEKWVKSDKSPSCWLGLPNLQKLTLSGHSHFDRIPEDFARLPLTYLDLSFTRVTDFSSLRSLQSLQVLSMQVKPCNNSFPLEPAGGPRARFTSCCKSLSRCAYHLLASLQLAVFQGVSAHLLCQLHACCIRGCRAWHSAWRFGGILNM